MVKAEVWVQAWCAAVVNAKNPKEATAWADEAASAYEKRFLVKYSRVGEGPIGFLHPPKNHPKIRDDKA